MIVSHINNVEGLQVKDPQVNNAVKKMLISPREGWDGHVMRLFELGEKGHTPKHSHPWPHINFVVKGKGTLHLAGKDYELKEGSFAFVPGGKEHQFLNSGKDSLSLICIVPQEGDK